MAERRGGARGVLITFEGGDGAGKSTQIRFLARLLEERGRAVLCLREPGGTAVGEALRHVVLDPAHGAMSDRAEVLCDRFFDSTVAYQGAGRGLDGAFIEAANRFACDGLAPDATILLVAPEEAVRSRMGRRSDADRLERAGAAFHRRVAAGFAALAAAEPERVRTVASHQQRIDTFRAVLAALASVLPEAGEALDADEAALVRVVDAVMVEKRRERAAEQRAAEQRKKGRGRRRGGKRRRGGAAKKGAEGHPRAEKGGNRG